MFFSASSLVSPSEMQPGSEGTKTVYPPSSAAARAVRTMMRRRRWRGRVTGSNECGAALRWAESALSRARRDAAK